MVVVGRGEGATFAAEVGGRGGRGARGPGVDEDGRHQQEWTRMDVGRGSRERGRGYVYQGCRGGVVDQV